MGIAPTVHLLVKPNNVSINVSILLKQNDVLALCEPVMVKALPFHQQRIDAGHFSTRTQQRSTKYFLLI